MTERKKPTRAKVAPKTKKEERPSNYSPLVPPHYASARQAWEPLLERFNQTGEAPPMQDWEQAIKQSPAFQDRVTKFTDDAKVVYLQVLCITGRHSEACRAAGVCNLTVKRHLGQNEAFKELQEEALAAYKDRIEKEVHIRAIEGWYEPVYQKGELVGTILRKSDKMLELLAKRHIPEYTDRVSMNANLSGGLMVVPAAALSDEDWEGEHGADSYSQAPGE